MVEEIEGDVRRLETAHGGWKKKILEFSETVSMERQGKLLDAYYEACAEQRREVAEKEVGSVANQDDGESGDKDYDSSDSSDSSVNADADAKEEDKFSHTEKLEELDLGEQPTSPLLAKVQKQEQRLQHRLAIFSVEMSKRVEKSAAETEIDDDLVSLTSGSGSATGSGSGRSGDGSQGGSSPVRAIYFEDELSVSKPKVRQSNLFDWNLEV
jgi:hypothetical protein